MKTAYPPEYLEFIRLFNEGKYFESHEVLESLWKKTEGEHKAFYQGLIQAAVALHHYGKANEKGMNYEFEKSSEKLSRYPVSYLGIDIPSFLDHLKEYLSRRKSAAPRLLLAD